MLNKLNVESVKYSHNLLQVEIFDFFDGLFQLADGLSNLKEVRMPINYFGGQRESIRLNRPYV